MASARDQPAGFPGGFKGPAFDGFVAMGHFTDEPVRRYTRLPVLRPIPSSDTALLWDLGQVTQPSRCLSFPTCPLSVSGLSNSQPKGNCKGLICSPGLLPTSHSGCSSGLGQASGFSPLSPLLLLLAPAPGAMQPTVPGS